MEQSNTETMTDRIVSTLMTRVSYTLRVWVVVSLTQCFL